MYFLKLEDIKNHSKLNEYVVKKLDEWLASQRTMSLNYINPLSFINECNIDRHTGLLLFSIASDKENFEIKEPFFQIKYLIDCPYCKNNFNTYYNSNDIPMHFVECDTEECQPFIPAEHPERVYILFKTNERAIKKYDEELKIYKKVPSQYLTRADKDARELFEHKDAYWKMEEEKGR